MRLVIQRSAGAEVWIDQKCFSRTEAGLVILFGTKAGDQEESCGWLADKAINLRIFEDNKGLMNLSALDIGGEIMVVSQFTLYADCHKGRRPSFGAAQEPVAARKLYDRFVELVAASPLRVATGQFGAQMDIRFTNQGPVTIILDHE